MTQQAELSVDVAVIGAGTAGLAAYRAAVARGARAVIIESGPYGTTCARVGCMPSKLLIAAAEAAHHAREAGPFGVNATVAVDGVAVMDRVKRERDRFVGFVVEGVEAIPEGDKVVGRARFVSPGVLDVEGRTVRARAVVVATGSSPFIPAAFSAVRDRVIVNDDVFSWDDLPTSAVVFGGGVVGLELGQALSRLGVRVRLFGKGGGLGPISDPVVKEAAITALSSHLSMELDASIVSVLPGPGRGVIVTSRDKAGVQREETFEALLVAAGRRPNLGALGLENAGVPLGDGPPKVDRHTLQWADTAVFVAGDVRDDRPLLHEASDEGRIAGDNAARFPAVVRGERRSALGIVFTDPQMAVVGDSYAEISARPDVAIGAVSFVDQGRSRVMRENHGAARLYADKKTGRFLGAELAGPRVEHLGHLLAWAHQAGLTVDQMLAMPFYHPVVEEGLRTALRDVRAAMDR
jgi:dihydrolipoamide dehydrogenase